jgi:hypothetical protein
MENYSLTGAQSRALPKTTEACRKRLAVLRDEIASIKLRLATNDIRRQSLRLGVDLDRFHRAKTALRAKQREVTEVSLELARLRSLEPHPSYLKALFSALRREVGDEVWRDVMQAVDEKADQRQKELI